MGRCCESFKFLGCTIQPKRCVPSKQSMYKILSDIQQNISNSKQAISELIAEGKQFDSKWSRSSVLHTTGKKIYGWEKSFSFCTHHQEFSQLDGKLQKYISDYEHWIRRKTTNISQDMFLQILGIPSTEALFNADQAQHNK
jgi:RNA-directed DNA polymerase